MRSKLTVQTQAQVRNLLSGFNGWYDDAQVARLGQQISQIVQSGQQAMAAAQNAYLSWAVSSQTGQTPGSAAVIKPEGLRVGTALPDVYARLGEQYRYSLSRPRNSPEDALRVTLNRANVMVDTDLVLAARKQSQETLKSSKHVIGYRRVIHPELSEGGTCGMCLVASDRLYRKADLLPIHARCHCEVVPVTKDEDPGSSLNNLSLGDLYDHAKGDQIFDLVRTRYRVEHHDELGPQLVPVNPDVKGWHEGASPEQIKALRKQIKQREGNDKVRRDMDNRLAKMEREAARAKQRTDREARRKRREARAR